MASRGKSSGGGVLAIVAIVLLLMSAALLSGEHPLDFVFQGLVWILLYTVGLLLISATVILILIILVVVFRDILESSKLHLSEKQIAQVEKISAKLRQILDLSVDKALAILKLDKETLLEDSKSKETVNYGLKSKVKRGINFLLAANEPANTNLFQLLPGQHCEEEEIESIRETLLKNTAIVRVAKKYSDDLPVVSIKGHVESGVSNHQAHNKWDEEYFDKTATPTGLPRKNIDAECPQGLVRLEMVCAEAWDGNMESHNDTEEYILSLLINPATQTIWDARGGKSRKL